MAMCDAKGYALKKPRCSLEREMLNTTGAVRVLLETHASSEIKTALGIPIFQVGNVFQCCYSVKVQTMVKGRGSLLKQTNKNVHYPS